MSEDPRPLDRQVIVRLPSELYRAATVHARADDRTLSQVMRLALSQYLANQTKKEKKR